MADVTLTYKGATIGELSESGNKNIKTAGKYCEADISLDYVKPGPGDNVVLALPDGYKAVNCVSIPLGGFVNTGVIPTNNFNSYYLDARLDTPVSDISNSAMLIGCRNSGSSFAYIGVYGSYTEFFFQILSSSYSQIGTKDNLRHVFQYAVDGAAVSVDTTIAKGVSVNATVDRPMLIGARQTQDGTGIERNCAMTVWRYAHIKGASKAIDLIPCQRKSDGQYGFYDLVSESFFGNSGTGTFTEGVE